MIFSLNFIPLLVVGWLGGDGKSDCEWRRTKDTFAGLCVCKHQERDGEGTEHVDNCFRFTMPPNHISKT